MSATADPRDADESPSSDVPSDDEADRSKCERLRAYLAEQVREQGELYFKSKFIADGVGLSAKEIGALMVQLQDRTTEFEVEKWSYTSATTWRITPAPDA